MSGSAKQLADFQSPFDIQLAEIGQRDEYYRRLFLKVARSPALLHANGRARKVFDHRGDADYWPHVSLLYGNHPAELKATNHRETVGDERKFLVDRLFLIDLAGEPRNWIQMGNFLFGKGRRQ